MLHRLCVTLFKKGDARLCSRSWLCAGTLCWAAALVSRTLSTRLKASMAAEATADDAHSDAERMIAARMVKTE